MTTFDDEADPLDPTDLATLPEFHNPVVSPDGDRLAYYYDGTGRNELYVQPLDGEPRQVSDGNVPRNARWHVGWLDDATVVFHRDEGGDEQHDLVGMDAETGETTPLVEPDGQAVLFDVSPAGRYLLYGSDEGEQMNAYRYDVGTGEIRQLTAYDRPVWSVVASPDGNRIAYLANESEDLANCDTYVMDADGSNKHRLDVGVDGAECHPADWFPDGERLLIEDNSEDRNRVGVYDLRTDEVTWVSDGDHEESAVAVAPDGRVLVTRIREAAVLPVVYDTADGDGTGFDSGRELDLPEGVAQYLPRTDRDRVFTADGRLVVAHTTPTTRKTLYLYDLDTDGTTILLEPEYEDVDPDTFVDAEYVTYESAEVPPWCDDGEAMEIGALLFDAREGPGADADATDLPGVVFVHGGPHAQAQRAFSPYVQFLVAKGYTVLQPNYRGSTGRGRTFKQAVHDDWGGMEQADIAAGGRWLADREWIDPDRLAVYGGSYGGFSAYSQLVRYPGLWATGVAWVGITDLPALYEESMPHYRTMLEQALGDPDGNADLWRERSPITHVDDMTDPILIIHGVNDARCPVSQARGFRDALEARGWTEGPDGDFEYEELGEEGHGSTDQAQKLRAFELLGDYLDRRL